MNKRSWIVAACAAGLAGAVAWACGPMFPNQLLDQRAATLMATPRNSFAFEAMHLLPPTDTLQAEAPGSGAEGVDRDAQAKALGLTAVQADRVQALRQGEDHNEVFEQGKDLPPDLRAYTAGAVAFAHGDMDAALARFEQVLALPAEQARLRTVWAAFMLGRIHAGRARDAADDTAVFQREQGAAAKAFQQARLLAAAGASDPQALAVASFGEEARLYLYSHGQPCSWGSLSDDENHCGDGIPASDLKRAVNLYAAQAGHGSDNGVQSLVGIAGNLMRDPGHMAELLDSPVVQRLLVAYALARLEGRTFDAVSGEAQKPDARLATLVQAIEQRGLDQVTGADRLAALAYETGRYDLAARLVDKAAGPLSAWVRAKLALRKGDLAAASLAYAEAARAFPRDGGAQPAIEPANVDRLTGERGVLSLARGEYVEAMGHLYDAATAVGGDGNVYDETQETAGAGYGNDVAYIAERVLTVDELKAFVDARAPATPPPAGKKEEGYYRNLRPLGDNLRWLLARRLMRAGRFEEALAYFPADADPRFGTFDEQGTLHASDLRRLAGDYAKALHDSQHAWTKIGKAQALYAAAVIAREHGMDILGYEQDPDYNDSSGNYQAGSGQAPASLMQALVTDGERQRFATSVATPDRRYHYRYVAANEAVAAADLLPPRSQAFAAVLCKATGWMLEGPPDYNDQYQGWGEPAPKGIPERLQRATALYQRYVKQGAHVEWARNFGRHCEEPDFNRARALKRSQQVAAVRHAVHRYSPYELAAIVVMLVALATWVVRRRRRGGGAGPSGRGFAR